MDDHHKGYAANNSRDYATAQAREQFTRATDRASAKIADSFHNDAIDDLINRIEARVIERETERQEETLFRNHVRSRPNIDEDVCVNQAESLLGSIERRIEQSTRHIEEIGHRLGNHADNVHGPMAPTNTLAGVERGTADKPRAALDRIFQALSMLDNATAYISEQADRNCGLA